MSNHGLFAGLGLVGLGLAFTAPAEAQLLARKDLSLAAALTIGTTAADLCKSQGYTVSVTVTSTAGGSQHGRNCQPRVRPETRYFAAIAGRLFRWIEFSHRSSVDQRGDGFPGGRSQPQPQCSPRPVGSIDGGE